MAAEFEWAARGGIVDGRYPWGGEDPQGRAAYLGFVFVGAGYAGVEGLAELQDFAAQAIELYPRCRAQGMRWVLVEAQERIMQEVPRTLSSFAEAELRGRGIEVRTGTTLALPVDAHNSVKLNASWGVSARTGNNFELYGIAWQYRFGGGL